MIIRLLFTTLSLLALCAPVFGQGGKKSSSSGSYKSYKLRSAQEDPEELLKEAEGLKSKRPGDALKRVKEALGLSIAREDVFHEGKCYVIIGEINEGIHEWKLAAENYQLAREKLSSAYSLSPEFLASLRGIGVASFKMQEYTTAVFWLEQALAKTISEKDKVELRLMISDAHFRLGDLDKAKKDIETSPTDNAYSNSATVRLYNQRAKITVLADSTFTAPNIYANSIQQANSRQLVDELQKESLQKTKEDIAGILKEQKRPAEEIALRNNSIEFNTLTKNMNEVARDRVAIGNTLAAEGQNSAAVRELEQAAVIADTLHNPETQLRTYLQLASLYEKTGRTTDALRMYRKYSSAVGRHDTTAQTQLLEKADLIRQQRDIEEVTKTVALGKQEEKIESGALFRQKLIIYGLLLIILIIAVTSWFIYRNARASARANQLLALKSLRSQMNPHFIFNALNSVNQFITEQDERTANRFLSELSRLMRLVLENSQEDFIPLNKEQEILSLYLGLEHYRFRDKFEYTVETDPGIQSELLLVPPMLIQPYIENAVWHGLRYRDSSGKLTLHFRKEKEQIVVEITDDGIGRKRSAALKTQNQKKHSSTALKNIEERVDIINKIYHGGYSVSVTDLDADHGTRVRISLPLKLA